MKFRFIRYLIDDLYRRFHWKPQILSTKESIDMILSNRLSVIRFGDGEMCLMLGHAIGYQESNKLLAERLISVLKEHSKNVLIGIPGALTSMDNLTPESYRFWRDYLSLCRRSWYKMINRNEIYCDTNLSRFYMRYQDKSVCDEYFKQLRRLWHNRDVIIVEGEYSRLGCDNDCFENARTIRRILCPAENAFNRYFDILKVTRENSNKSDLIIVALGPTAKILVNDLAEEGFQSLDLGHIDIEYSWWKMNAKNKIPVKGKYNNEARVNGDAIIGELTEKELNDYRKQIVANVTEASSV